MLLLSFVLSRIFVDTLNTFCRCVRPVRLKSWFLTLPARSARSARSACPPVSFFLLREWCLQQYTSTASRLDSLVDLGRLLTDMHVPLLLRVCVFAGDRTRLEDDEGDKHG